MPKLITKQPVEEQGEISYEIEKQLLSVEMLLVDSLILDHTYQRDFDSARVTKIANDWNWLGCGTLAVSLRKNGNQNEYAVIDGQQRLGAIRLQGFKEAPCRIYVDLTQQQEAELYELLNRNKKPGFNDLFKSRLMRGEEIAHGIEIACRTVGYYLDPERRHNGPASKDTHFYIQTMSELERIYKEGGILHLMDTLKFIKTTWAPEYLENQQMILAGVATFLKRYPKTSLPEMRGKLIKLGLNKSIQMALQWLAVHGRQGGGNNRGIAFAEGMLIAYNTNRQENNRIKSKAV